MNRRMVAAGVMLATIMQTIDSTIANVAMPHMQGTLMASTDQITWVLTSYIVASAIGTSLTGWLCDRWSQRQVLLISISGFTLASVLCGVAANLPEMIAARVLQGLLGAALVPLSQAVMLEITPVEQRGPAMALWGMGVMVGPVIGPTLGGWLTEWYGWRWVFFINVPVGLFAFKALWQHLPLRRGARAMRFDVFGFAMLSLAVGALQLMLDRGQGNDWFESTETWVELFTLLLAAAFFAVHARFTPASERFVDVRLLLNRNFFSGIVFVFVVGTVLYGTRALTPPLLQTLMQYPVLDVGLLSAPAGLGMMVGMMSAGRMSTRLDIRAVLLMGIVLTAVSLWQMTGYALALPLAWIVWPGFLQGLGLGLVFVPMSTAAFSTLPSSSLPQATPLYSLSRNLGSSLGISLVQTVLVRHVAEARTRLVETLPLELPASPVPLPEGGWWMVLSAQIDQQAAMIAYVASFKLMLVLTLCLIPFLALFDTPQRPDRRVDTARIETE